ncbi:MAG: cysteine--tRNA ligase [Nitrososphaerales archaeon]
MQIFNTLTLRNEELKWREDSPFRMFICGPTVQDNIHLGHAKTYIAFDVLARWLLKKGYGVEFLLNITDVDDKIFDRAKKENTPYEEIANKFYKEFIEDIDELNIVTISKIERVSNYVPEAMELVHDLLDKKIAYELEGSIYFDISKAKNFGKLSHQSPYQLKLKQIDAAPGKKNPVDFLLWRRTAEIEGVWSSNWLAKGRPGWHIEDSAIAFTEFQGPYDLHGGATELIFPHHEAELAQDEALSGQEPFVSHWMHTGLLLQGGEKMSKSLGNVLKIRDALKDYSADEIRYYFLNHHYRESFELDLRELQESRSSLEPIVKVSQRIQKRHDAKKDLKTLEEKETFRQFAEAMDEDLNTPKALSLLVTISKEMNSSSSERKDLSALFWHMVESLGFRLF